MLRPKTRIRRRDSVSSDGSEWETLYSDVGFSVLEKLLEPLDHVRFATVCKRWNSIAKDYNDIYRRWHSQQVLPMLMIPPSAALSQGVYSVSERRMYNSFRLPVPANEKYCGFSHGWLALIDESLTNITLRKFHAAPKSRRNVLHLPPLIPDYSYYATKSIPKVILSADPTLHRDYVVLAIFDHCHQVAYYAEQQNRWKHTSFSCYPKVVHAIFHRDNVYVVDTWGNNLFRFEAIVSNVGRGIAHILDAQPQINLNTCTYLVESTKGSLLLVKMVSARKEVSATAFKVYQLVIEDYSFPNYAQVLEVNSIGDESLFVCENHSMSVLASNVSGCQPNSIYYAYNSGSTWEIGIFSLENKTTTPLHSLNHGESSDNMPFWITPSFKGLFSES